MKFLILIVTNILISIYSSVGFTQSKCSGLFETFEPKSILEQTASVSERLFSEFAKGQTIEEGLKLKNRTSVPEFDMAIKDTVSNFEILLKDLINERRNLPHSMYSNLDSKEFYQIIKYIDDHIAWGKNLIEKGQFEYKTSVFFAYRSSLLYVFLRSSDLDKIPGVFANIPREKFIDMLEYSKTYQDALAYAALIRDELTINFRMLDAVLSDPLNTLYITTGTPSFDLTQTAAQRYNVSFVSFNGKITNMVDDINTLPFYRTYQNVLWAYAITSENQKRIGTRKPTLTQYIKLHSNLTRKKDRDS